MSITIEPALENAKKINPLTEEDDLIYEEGLEIPSGERLHNSGIISGILTCLDL